MAGRRARGLGLRGRRRVGRRIERRRRDGRRVGRRFGRLRARGFLLTGASGGVSARVASILRHGLGEGAPRADRCVLVSFWGVAVGGQCVTVCVRAQTPARALSTYYRTYPGLDARVYHTISQYLQSAGESAISCRSVSR